MMAVEREGVLSRILDWPAVRAELGTYPYDKATWNRLTEYYFSSLSRVCFAEFWEAFESEQAMQVAAGAPYLGSRELQMLPRATPISIFSAEDWGHVSPAMVGVIADLVAADKRVPKILSSLKERYGFHGFSGTELHQTLKTFVQFTAKAKRYLYEGSLSNAGLHFVIALDLLLGDPTKLTKSVSERTALIVHKQRGATFKECERGISAIYDARSRYVHRAVGAQLGGFRISLEAGKVITLQRRHNKGRFRIIWTKQVGPAELRAGVEWVVIEKAVGNEINFWGLELPTPASSFGTWLQQFK